MKHQQQPKPEPDSQGLPLCSPLVFHLGVARLGKRAKHDNALQLTRHEVRQSTDAVNINSVGCIQLSFLGSTGLVVEHADHRQEEGKPTARKARFAAVTSASVEDIAVEVCFFEKAVSG